MKKKEKYYAKHTKLFILLAYYTLTHTNTSLKANYSFSCLKKTQFYLNRS